MDSEMIHNSQQVFNDFTRFRMNQTRPASSGQTAVITHHQQNTKNDEFLKENKKEKLNLPVLLGSLVGTMLPIAVMIKKQGLTLPSDIKTKPVLEKAKDLYKTFNKIEFEEKELISMSLGGLLGGALAGAATDKEKNPQNRKNRIKEFIFQALNVSIPTILTGALVRQVSKHATKYKIPLQIAAPIIGVGAGMPAAAAISNKINKTFIDPEDKGKKIHPKNYLVHADDAVSALVLAKVPLVDKLPIKAILPVIFTNCGYETGTAKD